MANHSFNPNFAKRCGGVLPAVLATIFIKEFMAGSAKAVSLKSLAETTGETVAACQSALWKLSLIGMIHAPEGKSFYDTDIFKISGLKFLTAVADQAELDLEEEEFGDAGDGQIQVPRGERFWDERIFSDQIIGRCQLSEVRQEDGGDGICGYRLTISVRDVGVPVSDAIERIIDAGPYGTTGEAFEFWDGWADEYQIATAADYVEEPPTNPVSQVEDLIRSGILKPDGGGIIGMRLAPRSFRALGELLEIPDHHVAGGSFEASERNWQVFLDPDGIELDGLGESASGESEEAA